MKIRLRSFIIILVLTLICTKGFAQDSDDKIAVPIAKYYGLRIDNQIDERNDVSKAYLASSSYLRDLKEQYGRWDLACFAYLYGAALLNDVAQMSNIDLANISDNDIATLEQLLTINSPYGIYAQQKNDSAAMQGLYAITLQSNISAAALSSLIDLESGMIYSYNPSIRVREYLPTSYPIIIPIGCDTTGLNNLCVIEKARQDSIAAIKKSEVQKCSTTSSYTTHKVKQGESLGLIAKKYHTTVAKIRKNNNLKSDMIRVGQTLKIYK